MMKYLILLGLAVFSGLSSADEMYKVGSDECNYTWASGTYMYRLSEKKAGRDAGFDAFIVLAYRRCQVIKGLATGNQSLITEGLVGLKNNANHVASFYFIASYHLTGATLANWSWAYNDLKEALHYSYQTLAFINAYNKAGSSYPYETDLGFQQGLREDGQQIELFSLFEVPTLHMRRAYAVIYVEACNPDQDCEVKAEDWGYLQMEAKNELTKASEMALECKEMRNKSHFHTKLYQAVTTACTIIYETAESLKELDTERVSLLNKDNCNTNLNETDCPEYYEVESEIERIYNASKVKIAAEFKKHSLRLASVSN